VPFESLATRGENKTSDITNDNATAMKIGKNMKNTNNPHEENCPPWKLGGPDLLNDFDDIGFFTAAEKAKLYAAIKRGGFTKDEAAHVLAWVLDARVGYTLLEGLLSKKLWVEIQDGELLFNAKAGQVMARHRLNLNSPRTVLMIGRSC
jgi:hypothetical protein